MAVLDTHKIAKNTVLLYLRMFLLMAVTLYTSRVILKVLGIEDYGIYNLIAGFVTFLSFITNAMVIAMQRYFNTAIGRSDKQNYKEVYSMSINILIIFSFIIILIGETLGLWIVRNFLNIPSQRYDVAQMVYQMSLLTFVVNTLRTPFHATIIAHERMSFYAYLSMFEGALRLGMVFLLIVIPYDHLFLYTLLYLIITIFINSLYILYCKKEFEVCTYSFNKDKRLFKELVGFSGWSLLGQTSAVIKNQGEAILINRFFTVAANAAMGIAVQVTGALEMFVSNFQTAFNPQLIQSYASNDFNSHYSLLFKASRFSYFLLLVLLIPVVSHVDFILGVWLVEVPNFANYFISYILISYLLNALSSPFVTSISATGKIKQYQIAFSAIFLTGLLIVYVVLRLGAMPYSISIVAILIQFILMLTRLYFAHKLVAVSCRRFFVEVLIPIILVSVLSIIVPYINHIWAESAIEQIIAIILEVGITGVLVFFIGMNKTERLYVLNIIKHRK